MFGEGMGICADASKPFPEEYMKKALIKSCQQIATNQLATSRAQCRECKGAGVMLKEKDRCVIDRVQICF